MGKEQFDLTKFTGSSDQARPGDILVQGPTKVGKTFLAATISEYYPEELPAKDWVDLKDLVWISWDAGATDGFRDEKLRVDVINPTDMIAEFGAPRTILLLPQIVRKYVQEGGKKWVVVDTVSMLDVYLLGHFTDNPIRNNKGEVDTQAKFGAVLANHQAFYRGIRTTGASAIWLTHSKVTGDTSRNERLALTEMTQHADPSDIIPDITGKGAKVYTGNSSEQFVLLAKKIPGKKGGESLKRVLYPFGNGQFQGGTRFGRTRNFEEEPHLGKLLRRDRGE